MIVTESMTGRPKLGHPPPLKGARRIGPTHFEPNPELIEHVCGERKFSNVRAPEFLVDSLKGLRGSIPCKLTVPIQFYSLEISQDTISLIKEALKASGRNLKRISTRKGDEIWVLGEFLLTVDYPVKSTRDRQTGDIPVIAFAKKNRPTQEGWNYLVCVNFTRLQPQSSARA